MANILLAFPDRASTASISGGSFAATLPASNMTTSVITQVARTSSTALADTQFTADLGRVHSVSVLGILNHNLSIAARVRVTSAIAGDFSATTYDSGWMNVWPSMFSSLDLEWEDDNYWAGTLDADSIGTMRPAFVLPLSAVAYGRYWKVEIDDRTNGDGFVDIGRIFIGPSWTPQFNATYGWGIAWQPDAAVEKSLGGTLYFSPRSTARRMSFSLDFLSKAEAHTQALEMQRQLGSHAEMLVVSDKDDAETSQQRSFLARISQSSEVRLTRPGLYSVSFELTEVV